MSNEIDPVAFGKLIANVETLTTSINTLTKKVEILEERMNTGKGLALGIVFAAASIGGSIGAFAHKIMDVMK